MTETGGKARLSPLVGLYSLANFGSFICFVPLISLILPQRTAEFGQQASVNFLSQILFAGGLAASGANIVSGWLSDRLLKWQSNRLPLIGIGLGLTLACFASLATASNLPGLIWSFVAFQIAFNLMFAPLTALAADHFSDSEKGRLFGWLSLALPAAQGVTTLLALSSLESISGRLMAVALLACMLIVPLLGAGVPSIIDKTPATPPKSRPALSSNHGSYGLRDFLYVWIGRMLVQCGSVAVGSYLLLHLTSLPSLPLTGFRADDLLGRILLLSLVGSLCAGPLAGYWSDRTGRRVPFLQIGSLLVALGCGAMAFSGSWVGIAGGYAAFAMGLSAFLTIDSAIIAQILGSQSMRAFKLGIMNLTNTLPTILVPGALLLVGKEQTVITDALFLAVACAAIVSLVCATRLKGVI